MAIATTHVLDGCGGELERNIGLKGKDAADRGEHIGAGCSDLIQHPYVSTVVQQYHWQPRDLGTSCRQPSGTGVGTSRVE